MAEVAILYWFIASYQSKVPPAALCSLAEIDDYRVDY